MGVKGLWRLLLPIGHRISIETLSGKTLAIDASIWLTQFLKAMRDPETGSVRQSAHLLGFIRRICKLLYHGIRPVFVFDGATPEIKLREIKARRQRRERMAMGVGLSGEGADADNAVKRMARRLLVAELRRNKEIEVAAASGRGDRLKSTPTGTSRSVEVAPAAEGAAFVPGFNPGEDSCTGNKSRGESENTNRAEMENFDSEDQGSKEMSVFDVGTTSQSRSDQQPSTTPVVVDLAKQEGSAADDVNDWDDTQICENSSNSSASSPDQNGEIQIPLNETDELDVEAVSALPDSTRKDVIETARRQQRMRSRREFMPVAANPEAYSQVQLRNFLRTSSLNKKINETGARAAMIDRGENGDGGEGRVVGERIASDATKRFIFIKDGKYENTKTKQEKIINRQEEGRPSDFCGANRSGEDETGGKQRGEDACFESNGISHIGEHHHRRLRKRTKAGAHGNEEESDDEGMFRSDADENARTMRMLDSSDDDRTDGSVGLGNTGGFMAHGPEKAESGEGSKKKGALLSQSRLQINNSDDSSSEFAGGFIPAGSNTISPQPSKERHFIVVSSNNHTDDDSYGHGQMTEDEYVAKANHDTEHGECVDAANGILPFPDGKLCSKHLAAVPEKGKGPFMTKSISFANSNASHFLSEKALAAPNHSEEKNEIKSIPVCEPSFASIAAGEDGGRKMPHAQRVHGVPAETEAGDVAFDHVGQRVGLPSVVDCQGQSKTECGSDDSEEIDWEDGDSADDTDSDGKLIDRSDLKDKDISMLDASSQTGCDDNFVTGDELKDEEVSDTFCHSAAAKSVEKVVEAKLQPTESKPDFSAQGALHSEIAAIPEDVSEQSHSASREVEAGAHAVQKINSKDKSCMLVENEPGSSDDNDLQAENDFDQEFKTKTAAALEQAQATASNLTNWAGQAVRRAIAAHVEETHQGKSFPMRHEKKQPSSDEAATECQYIKVVEDCDKTNGSAAAQADSREDLEKSPKTTQPLPEDKNELLDMSLDALRGQDEMMSDEMKRQQRDMDTVTEEMKEEVVQLLQYFGIPYIESPAEAESQCATLEDLGLVDGIVTEDSDVFVFGGKNIYRNIFDDQKYVEVYLAKDAEKELGLQRNEMCALAMLLGGDYTDGIKGVGIVNAMEILQAFDVSEDIKGGLMEFRKWMDGFDSSDCGIGCTADVVSEEQKLSKAQLFHRKHRTARTRWVAPKDFPAENVLNAYMNPVVDTSKSKFSWGMPDLENIRTLCYRKIGWRPEETDKVLLPVIEKMESGSRQTRIESYFMTYQDNIKFANVRSKRLKSVLNDIRNAPDGDSKSSTDGSLDITHPKSGSGEARDQQASGVKRRKFRRDI